MEEVGKLLPTLFKRHVGRADSRVIEILGALWPRVAGKGIAENSVPTSFVDGKLTLETTCASWAVQLRQMNEEVRKGINQSLGCSVVKEIKVQLAPALGQRDPEISKSPTPITRFNKTATLHGGTLRWVPRRPARED